MFIALPLCGFEAHSLKQVIQGYRDGKILLIEVKRTS